MWSCAIRSSCTARSAQRAVVLARGLLLQGRCNSTLVVCDTPLEEVVGRDKTSRLAPDAATRSVLTAAQQLNVPTVHLLVVGPQAPNVVPNTVKKVRHLPTNEGTGDEQIFEAIEDAIVSNEPCTHVLMAAKAGGETSSVLTEAQRRFVGSLVPNVVAIESQDTFLVGKEKMRRQNKDMLKLLSIQAEEFPEAPLPTPNESVADVKEPEIDVVQAPSTSSRLAFKVLPVVVMGLVLLCCL